jgi:hypothetical protein
MQILRRNAWLPTVFAVALVFDLGCSSPPSDSGWPEALGYSSSEVSAIEIDSFGFPNVPVTVGGQVVMLPFDTGNMIGVSLSTTLFDQLGLTAVGTYDRVNSAGETVATLRLSQPQQVAAFGKDIGLEQIYEFDHPTLPGLMGPGVLEGGHFTLDYRSRQIAVGGTPLPSVIPGHYAVPLVRSDRHRTLILVRGTIEGRSVVMELDTGKSRTVVNPELAAELDLKSVSRGVRINSLQIGELSFSIPSAKKVDQSSIDPRLPEPILVGVGSDILAQFVWTVDYDAGVLWLESAAGGVSRIAPS